ncbi:MAG: phosphoribosylformylglycinamidine synthase subunit PurL [Chloroflexi bacterium]|nr:phosphoribosylformylglycinamidine synthase subunit PurL [Chloroflexota bacterium]
MQITRIEVHPRAAVSDGRLVTAAHQLGYPTLAACSVTRLFFVSGSLSEADAHRLAQHLLSDPVTETYTLGVSPAAAGRHLVERTLLPGVTDAVADSLKHAASLIGLTLDQAATGDRYELEGDLTPAQVERIARGVLANTVIHRLSLGTPIDAPFIAPQPPDDTVEIIPVRGLNDADLTGLSGTRRLSLDLNEMRAIQGYFDEIQRDPTDAELEMLAQTWSEHCVHKTFRAKITYTGPAHGTAADSAPVTQDIDGLLKTYIRAATESLNKAWVRSAFVDNAGIVAFDDRFDVAFKVETHNRPSALEPFGGANTGAGGVIRDVLGVSARPIANTDVLCFGMPDTPAEALPHNVLHPRRVIDGVIHGIEDYGNKMGIPTVNGAVHYHPGYTANPLVFAGCVGLVPRGAHKAEAQPDDLIVVIGGRTGRDGLRGATFSSMEMDTSTAQLSGGAVQIGNPIAEKQVPEVVLKARDAGLYTAITDCGAGGLSSAVGEMGKDLGARVQLTDVPLKYPGLRPWEIWLSEAQERMVFAVPPSNWAAFQTICDAHDVEAVNIGTFAPTGQLTLYYGEKVVGDVSMAFLHGGIPRRELKAEWTPAAPPAPQPRPAPRARTSGGAGYGDTLLTLLTHPTIRSKADVIHRYDHEVGTGTAVKPLVGRGAGPGDAAVIVPLDALREEGSTKAIALSVGLCPQYTAYDPYAMAWAAVDEAIRNAVAVGADPDTISILDNFSWGNTQLPDRLGALVRCSQGCYDAAITYGTPFISGKDSLNNEYVGLDGQRHSIPGTLVISALGMVPDATRTVTSDFKQAGNLVYVVGATRDELGGSAYFEAEAIGGGTVPQPVRNAPAAYRALHQAIRAGYVTAAHDPSEGGLAVALAEMCIGGQVGADINLSAVYAPAPLSDDTLAFSESQGRMVVEVTADNGSAFETLLTGAGIDFAAVGEVGGNSLRLSGYFGRTEVSVDAMTAAWGGVSNAAQTQAMSGRASEARPQTTRTSTGKPILILHATGSNRDRDAALACELAGGSPEIVTINQLTRGERHVRDYAMLVIPGGFSYGDDLGAGVLWALDLRERIPGIDTFIEAGKPVLGICNGFQTLVKSGYLPGGAWDGGQRSVTLTYNEGGRFECRWVELAANPKSPCLFTEGLVAPIYAPIAHGEGRVMVADEATRQRLMTDGLAALTYVGDGYPANPNGSVDAIAGLCNPAGNVFGLMPHPENHIFPWQHPQRLDGYDGLPLFVNGVRRA